MIESKIVNIREYLAKNPDTLVTLILMADAGEREILVRVCGGEGAAFGLVRSALQYGENCKIYGIENYQIGLTTGGRVAKQPHRLAGLLIVGIENFYATISN